MCYAEPIDIKVSYYEDYEETSAIYCIDQKFFYKRIKMDVSSKKAVEGFFYIDTSGLEPGIYAIFNMGQGAEYFLVEII